MTRNGPETPEPAAATSPPTTEAPLFDREPDDDIRRQIRRVFLAAGLLFLVNILLGAVNAVTAGPIPRWQVLTHLHAGTVGWITLGVIGFAIWLCSNTREVRATDVKRVRWLTGLSIVAFTGLIASFGIAYSQGGAALYLVPIFGSGAALVIWSVAIYAVTQLRRQPTVTTPHILVVGGLLIGSLGVTVGVLIGIGTAIEGVLPITHDQGIFGHQLTVETYLLLVATGIVEWLGLNETSGRWTRAGVTQAIVGGVAGLVGPLTLLLLAVGLPEETVAVISLVSLLGFLLFTGIFLVRIGHHALRTNPFRPGVGSWVFFGTLWLVTYVLSFFVSPAIGSPDWLTILTLHSLFVGVMTNLLLGVLSARTHVARDSQRWVEISAVWLLNGGMVVFFILEATRETSHGALLMGAGVLLGVVTMLRRLLEQPVEDTSHERAEDAVTE